MEENIVEVRMGELCVQSSPARLITRALGSCLGITLYNPLKKIGAMAHPMLPDISRARQNTSPTRYVNYAINKMTEELEKMGSARNQLIAKLFGGARMFSFITADNILNVGEKNIAIARTVLTEMCIKVAAEEVGGNFGRTIELNLENGKVLVATVSWGRKEV